MTQAKQAQEQWVAVDRYFAEQLSLSDAALDAALAANKAAELPAIDVAPNQGKLLQLLAQMVGAKRILEIGTLAGYSAIWLARALPAGGRLVTLEVDAKHARVARENIGRAQLADIVDIHEGRAIETLERMVAATIDPFDLIFIDADKPSYPLYLPLAVELSHPGTLIIADNIVRKGAVIEPSHSDPRVHGVREFNERVARRPRLDATLLQTVGVKGYDGFTLARVVS